MLKIGWSMAAVLLAVTGFMQASTSRATDTIHGFALEAIEGGPLPLSQYAGQPILLVNTASLCGFTYQYEQLQAVWDRYEERGLIVLGVPSNDFGRQEPGAAAEIKDFCEVNFAVTFPMSDKIAVSGSQSHPLFEHIRDTLGEGAGPKWNFYKYLIDANGVPRGYWPSQTDPDDDEILQQIDLLLVSR